MWVYTIQSTPALTVLPVKKKLSPISQCSQRLFSSHSLPTPFLRWRANQIEETLNYKGFCWWVKDLFFKLRTSNQIQCLARFLKIISVLFSVTRKPFHAVYIHTPVHPSFPQSTLVGSFVSPFSCLYLPRRFWC